MESVNFKSNLPILEKIGRKIMGGSIEKGYYQKFYKNIKYPKSNGKRVLMYIGIGHMYLTPIEVLMYHALRKEGVDVDYCVYDENIQINEVVTKARVDKVGKETFWNKSLKNARRILKASNVEYEEIKISDEVSKVLDSIGQTLDELFAFKHGGVNFGHIVEGVMYRYYKSLTFGNDALEVARKFMHTSLTNYFFIKEKCSEKDYDYILFSHGIYCTWQPVVEYCNLNSLPYVCYDRAKIQGHCNFNLNNPSPVWEMNEAWERLAGYDLSSEELDQVAGYLAERELQKGDVYAYNFAEKVKDLPSLKEKMGINKGDKVITIFTNLIWDAANVSRDIAFESPMDCIRQTITRYAEKEGVHILLRPHPAEQVLGTEERYAELVKAAFDNQLPTNVTIIEHDWKVNSFSVLEMSDIGIIHTSTVGLEMAIEGKATLLISETHYRGKGFTFDAINPGHYFELIDGILNGGLAIKNQMALAKKYFYFMMFEYQHRMPMTFTDQGVFDGYGYQHFNDLYAEKGERINKIISRLCGKQPYDDFIFR